MQSVAACFLTSKKAASRCETEALRRYLGGVVVPQEPMARNMSEKVLRMSLAEEHPQVLGSAKRVMIRPSLTMNGIKMIQQNKNPTVSSNSISYSIDITKLEEKEVPNKEIENHNQNLSHKMINYISKVKSATAKTIKADQPHCIFKEGVSVSPVKRALPAQPIVINQKPGLLKMVSLKRKDPFMKDEIHSITQPPKTVLRKFLADLSPHPVIDYQGFENKSRDHINIEIALAKVKL